MGSQIVSDRGNVTKAAAAVSTAASGLGGGSPATAGSSTGQGYDAMVELAARIHPLMGRVSAALAAEATACAEMARTFEEADREVADAWEG